MAIEDLPFLPVNSQGAIADTSPALFDDASTEWMTYGALRKSVESLLSFYRYPEVEGVPTPPRGLVFCCAPRSIDGVCAYLAAAQSGHAVMMVDPSIPRLSSIAEPYCPEWIVAPTDASFNGDYEEQPWPLKSLTLWRRKKPCRRDLHPDLFLLLLTSGSTGNHKAVRLSYKNIASNTAAIIESLGQTWAERALAHMPLSYSFGLSIVQTQLTVGGSCLLSEQSMMSGAFWKRAQQQKATLFGGVPYHYEMLLRLGLERLDVPDLKTFLQAGGSMRPDMAKKVLEKIQARHGKLFIMYGQTEASPRISCFALQEHPEKIGSAGRVLSGGRLVVEDGEIIYIGPNVMMGYAEKREDLELGDVMKDTLATGDMGYVDMEGYLFLTGRKQRFAKVFGKRVSLDDLERIAREIAPAYAVEGQEKVVIFVADQDEEVCAAMRRHVAAETNFPPTWFDVRAVEEIPHYPNGKIDYPKLRQQAQE